MEFQVSYRLDEGWSIGRKGTRAHNQIWREGCSYNSSEYSEIEYISVSKLNTTHKKKCFDLVPTEKAAGFESKWHASSTPSTQNIYGPASLRNGCIIYPCDRFMCKVSCSCQICRKKYQDYYSESNNSTITEHQTYHKACHMDCDLCSEVYKIIPMYKFIIHFWTKDDMWIPYNEGIFKHRYKISSDTVETKLKCDLCDIKFSRVDLRSRHYFSMHNKESYICSSCNKVFKRKDLLVNHEEEAHETSLGCYDCRTRFQSLRALKKHKKEKFDESKIPKYSCDECGESYCTQRILNQHMKKHRNTCEDCGKNFSRLSCLSTHKRNPKLNCELCLESFCNKRQLLTHSLENHQKLDCSICGTVFSSKFALIRHRWNKHEVSD